VVGTATGNRSYVSFDTELSFIGTLLAVTVRMTLYSSHLQLGLLLMSATFGARCQIRKHTSTATDHGMDYTPSVRLSLRTLSSFEHFYYL
jgi:hypothetical protein